MKLATVLLLTLVFTWMDGTDSQGMQVSVTSEKKCGSPNDPIQLRTTSFPEFIDMTKPFNFSIIFSILENIEESEIEMLMEARKYVLMWWQRTPCPNGKEGPCKISDVCKLLPGCGDSNSCPTNSAASTMPCGCPLKKGEYRAENVQMNPGSSGMPKGLQLAPGSYQVRVSLRSPKAKGKRLGCAIRYIKVQ